MASGDKVADLGFPIPPDTTFAVLNAIKDASSPPTRFPCYDFGSTDAYLNGLGRMLENYDGGGVKMRLPVAASATSGNIKLCAAFRRLDENSEDLDAAMTWSEQNATITAPGTATLFKWCDILFSNSQIDGILKGELFQWQIRRDNSVGSNMVGIAKILCPPHLHLVEQ